MKYIPPIELLEELPTFEPTRKREASTAENDSKPRSKKPWRRRERRCEPHDQHA